MNETLHTAVCLLVQWLNDQYKCALVLLSSSIFFIFASFSFLWKGIDNMHSQTEIDPNASRAYGAYVGIGPFVSLCCKNYLCVSVFSSS